jgi:hypothetical protein
MSDMKLSERFQPERFFRGTISAQGILQDRFGGVRRRFRAVMVGRMNGDALTIDETFRFDDGESSKRIWCLKPLGAGRYEGTAHDIVGVARGQTGTNYLRLHYRMKIRIGRRHWAVRFRDTMYSVGNRHIINKASLYLFGIRIADLTVAMTREDRASSGDPAFESA